MAAEIPWRKTVGAKLGMITFMLFALVIVLVVTNFLSLSWLRSEMNWINSAGKGRKAPFHILFLAHALFDATGDSRERLAEELRQEVKEMGDRYQLLRQGDRSEDIAPANDPRILLNIKVREERYRAKIKPLVDRVISAPTRAAAQMDLAALDEVLRTQSTEANSVVDMTADNVSQLIHRDQLLQYVLVGVVIAMLALVIWIARDIARRTRSLFVTANEIAGGRLNSTAPVSGSDELAALGSAFNTMTANLRQTIETEQEARRRIEKLLERIRQATGQLSAASAEIMASTTQHAAGAQEQAAAVAQTVATVDEVTQTAEQGAQRAKAVGDSVQRTLEIGKNGRKVVDDSLGAMATVKEQVETTAKNILLLAEQAQAIGEIIATVNDVAEQTNLLALNAAIEASRAGEHGKGFAVVAGEVKALADQSKKATGQVRQILGEIQKATNTAVLSTEEVTKGVATAINVAGQASDTIIKLAETLGDTARAVTQITASVGQQATGVGQIHQAMKNIDQVAKQNSIATRQVAQAAEDLNSLGTQLAGLASE